MNYKKESEMFNLTSSYYDLYRPSYPENIIQKLIKDTNLKELSNIVEIGSGSGKATSLLCNKGYNILALDPGVDLVKLGNEKLGNKNVKFEVGRFEEYPLKSNYYDLVFSAQAFHWIPEDIAYKKSAAILKDTGYLGLIWNMYITYDNPVDKDLIAFSNKYGGIADFLTEDGCNKRIESIKQKIIDSGLFSSPIIIKELWVKEYTLDEFYGFMLTGNRFVQKSEEDKLKAYQELSELINKYGGKILRPYLCCLYMAKKKGGEDGEI